MLLREALLRDLVDSTPAERINAVLARVLARELDPYTAVAQLVAER